MSQFPSTGESVPSPAVDKNSGLAIAALVLGIVGLVTACVGIGAVMGVVAVTLGGIALVQIGKSGRPARGKGMALTGVIMGGLCVLMLPLVLGIMLPAVASARRTANAMRCMSQIRLVNTALAVYAQKNGGDFPPDLNTLDRFMTSSSGAPSGLQLHCPAVAPNNPDGDYIYPYLYHNEKAITAPATTVLVYESMHNHGRGFNAGFADGSVRFVRPEEARQLGIDVPGN